MTSNLGLCDNTSRMNQKEFESILTLSPRELEVFHALGDGQPTYKIAKRLDMSVKTVESHIAHIKDKIGHDHVVSLRHFATRFAVFCEDNKVKVAPIELQPRPPRFQFQPA